MKKLFNVLYFLRFFVLGIVIALGIVFIFNIWSIIDGSSVDIPLLIYLILEFIAGIVYLFVLKHVKETYYRSFPNEKIKKPVKNKTNKHVQKVETAPEEAAPEVKRKAYTIDDTVQLDESVSFKTTVGGYDYAFRIHKDGRVYNEKTANYIGFMRRGKK